MEQLKSDRIQIADTGLASINAEWNLINPAPRHRKLLPCFSDKETDAILDSVHRTTTIGKRDYAIIMLALWTGLRGVDILDLKRSDIDWNRKVINVVQGKTVVGIQTKLSPGVGNAIADYILNGRPETNSPYIFPKIPLKILPTGATRSAQTLMHLEKMAF